MRLALSLLTMLAATTPAAVSQTPDRLLAIGGSVTEIVHALGEGDRLVGRDTTSTYPPQVQALPDVGYMRALSPEGVLSVRPDLVIAEDGAGPPEAIDVVRKAGIAYVPVPDATDRAGIIDKILTIGAALGDESDAEALAASVDADLRATEAKAAAIPPERRKRVLFVLSNQGGRIMAGGANTAAEGIIRLAGGVNAVDGFDGYKPLTDEAITRAAPDLILMMARSGDHAPAEADLLTHPAIATTPAAATGALVRMDGLYQLGFGPRTAQAAADLAAMLYGGME